MTKRPIQVIVSTITCLTDTDSQRDRAASRTSNNRYGYSFASAGILYRDIRNEKLVWNYRIGFGQDNERMEDSAIG